MVMWMHASLLEQLLAPATHSQFFTDGSDTGKEGEEWVYNDNYMRIIPQTSVQIDMDLSDRKILLTTPACVYGDCCYYYCR